MDRKNWPEMSFGASREHIEAHALTPALSRWERENLTQSHWNSCGWSCRTVIHKLRDQRWLFPSPSGRGIKGEGEPCDNAKRFARLRTEKTRIIRCRHDCGVRTTLPHPSPLPLGEGESQPVSRKITRPHLPDAHPKQTRHITAVPSPSGRGSRVRENRAKAERLAHCLCRAIALHESHVPLVLPGGCAYRRSGMSRRAFRQVILFGLVALSSLLQVPVASAKDILPPGFRPRPIGVHALVGGKVVVKPGETLDGATIIIRDGLIEAVGKDLSPPADARVWDMKGLTIYAGFIEPYA